MNRYSYQKHWGLWRDRKGNPRTRLEKMMRIHILILLILAALAMTTAAQPNPYDYILGDGVSRALYWVDHAMPGALNVLHVPTMPRFPNGVVNGFDNVSLLYLASTTSAADPDRLRRWTPAGGGVVANLGIPGLPNAVDIDQYADPVISTEGLNNLRSVSGGAVAVMYGGLPAAVHGFCIDGDSGDSIVATSAGGGSLLRYPRIAPGAGVAIAAGLGNVTAVAHHPQTGNFVVASRGPGLVRMVTPAGVVMWTAPFPGASGARDVKVSPEIGQILACGGQDFRIYSAAGAPLLALAWGGHDFKCVEEYQTRKVAGRGNSAAGGNYFANFNFPRSPGQVYRGLMSFSMRPGLPAGGGRTLNLANDALFAAVNAGALDGSVLAGRLGILDGNGHGVMRITLPAAMPAGLRLYVSAVAINPAMPGGIDLGNTTGFTTD